MTARQVLDRFICDYLSHVDKRLRSGVLEDDPQKVWFARGQYDAVLRLEKQLRALGIL